MTSTQDPIPRPHASASFLNCPRCGLSIGLKARWLAIEDCPRCMARAGIPVKLFSSPLPTEELYDQRSAPSAKWLQSPTSIGSGRR